jgi:hypothetical protein
MLIRRTSMITGKEHTMELDITPRQLERWWSGELIQSVMPHLTDAEREFVLTGITPDEWGEHVAMKDEEAA